MVKRTKQYFSKRFLMKEQVVQSTHMYLDNTILVGTILYLLDGSR